MVDDLAARLRSPTHFALFRKNVHDDKSQCLFCYNQLSTSNDVNIKLDSRAHKSNLKQYGVSGLIFYK